MIDDKPMIASEGTIDRYQITVKEVITMYIAAVALIFSFAFVVGVAFQLALYCTLLLIGAL